VTGAAAEPAGGGVAGAAEPAGGGAVGGAAGAVLDAGGALALGAGATGAAAEPGAGGAGSAGNAAVGGVCAQAALGVARPSANANALRDGGIMDVGSSKTVSARSLPLRLGWVDAQGAPHH
jgi:hypothetical protein